MKVALDISNLSRAKTPEKNDIILFDGKKYYITTLKDILTPIYAKLADYEMILSKMKVENDNFKKETAKSIIEIAKTTKKIMEEKKI